LVFKAPGSELLRKHEVSFPSGEAATGFALACVLTRLFPRGRPAFYAGGSLAALARLVNGAHYVSDVAAGAMLGVLVAGAVFKYVERRSLGDPAQTTDDVS
jgi:membrane-associated phospholipid phosphatase